jgi:hypothetical protein
MPGMGNFLQVMASSRWAYNMVAKQYRYDEEPNHKNRKRKQQGIFAHLRQRFFGKPHQMINQEQENTEQTS